MKKVVSFGLSLLAVLVTVTTFAQKRITEGTISYDIVINTGEADPKIADMFDGALSVVYLKANKSRSELVSSLGTQSTIVDGRTGNATVLKEYGETKYMITMTAANWKESNQKYEGVEFTYLDEYKEILGYKCQKAVGKLKDGSEFTVFYTPDLIPENKDFQYANKGLNGLAMEYESSLGKIKVVYTVSKISFNIVPASKFDLPKSGYRVMTYEESMKLGAQ
ncbi:MAG: hypothetical protein J0M30_07910 [Chitinophagales bacterium]|nr:hypothetical protein [Chitinophagales bacterium]